MALTAAQRAEINRQNAQKSTGPKSDEGKAASRRNATRHGLRAEVLSLPDEDPAIAASRSEAWNDYYQPQSPAAQHLVNTCVAATLLSDRCHKFHTAALSQQIRTAELQWDLQRENAVEALAVFIETEPAHAVHGLKQSAHGLRWMIEGWERLEAALTARGRWTNPERDLAIRLQGLRPDPEHVRAAPQAWIIRLFALLCHDNPSDQAIRFLFDEKLLPDLYRHTYRVNLLPDREVCRNALRATVARELERLRHDEARYQAFDEPDRAEAGARALILHDPASARLFLRYHSEARNAFQRAYSALIPTLARDAEAAETAPAAAPEATSPNEADSEATPEQQTPCDEPSDPDLTPVPLPQRAETPAPRSRMVDDAPAQACRLL